MSTKGLTKDLINRFSILNGAKYFSSKIFEGGISWWYSNLFVEV